MSTHEYHFRDQQWLFARVAQDNGSYQNYLIELLEVWKVADAETRQQLHDGQPPSSFADCVRYALIYATIVGNLRKRYPIPSAYSNDADMSQSLTPEALFKHMAKADELVRQTPIKAADEISDPRARADALIDLMEQDPNADREPILRSAIDSILVIRESYWEFPDTLWKRLAVFLSDDDLSGYTPIVLSAENEIARAWFIGTFAKTLPQKLRRDALRATLLIHDPTARAFTLRSLLPRSRRKQRVKILLAMYQTVGKITEPRWRSRILVELVGQLDGEQRSRVIRLAVATIPLVAGSARGRDADRLLPYLSQPEKDRFLQDVLSGKGVISQIEAYLTLWSHLSTQTRQKAMKIALGLQDPQSKAEYLAKIAGKLRAGTAYREAVQQIAHAILAIRNEDNRHRTLQAVQREIHDKAIERIANVPTERLTPNIETLLGYRFAFAERDRQYIAYALGNLAGFMSETRRVQVLPLMVDLALEIDLHDYVAEAIEGIAPYLDEYHLNKALEGALQIGDSWSRVWALCGLAAFLKGKQRKKCLDAAVEASGLMDSTYQADSWFEVDMAARLLPHLKGRIRERILAQGLAAAQINDFKAYDARIRFLPYLDGERQSTLAATILTDIPQLLEEGAQAYTLSSIAGFLPPDQVDLAMQSARTIRSEDQREGALSALIPHLPNVEIALKLAQILESPYYQAVALTELLARFTREARNNVLQLAMATIENIEMPRYRIAGWIGLSPHVDAPALIRRKVIEAVLDYLWEVKEGYRNNILALCSEQQLFSVNIFPVDVLRESGEHVMQVCMEWKW